MTLSLRSTAFPPGGEIPKEYTCDGEDVSPPLAWSGAPAGTKSFVLIVDDPDAPDPKAPKTTWVHWVLYDIPASATALPNSRFQMLHRVQHLTLSDEYRHKPVVFVFSSYIGFSTAALEQALKQTLQ